MNLHPLPFSNPHVLSPPLHTWPHSSKEVMSYIFNEREKLATASLLVAAHGSQRKQNGYVTGVMFCTVPVRNSSVPY